MANSVDVKTCVVVPNWNGESTLAACLDSLMAQTVKPYIIVVDNGSVDGSLQLLQDKYPAAEIIRHTENKGYAGGVNPGFRRAVELQAAYAAPFNNDAVAEPTWLEELVKFLDDNPATGIATCKLLGIDGHIDSTGEAYSVWGLPYPRGRGETDTGQYDNRTDIFGASGGASLYRVGMLDQIGLFDEDFFAYYEDVDLSFRAQLADWKVAYVPTAVVHHATGSTSKKIKGFTTYQTIKNLPLLFWKNIPPGRIFLAVLPRFTLAYLSFIASALARGQLWPVAKGLVLYAILLPKKLIQRYRIQTARKVPKEYIWQIITHDLPPNAQKLRKLRLGWWKIAGKSNG